MFNPDQFKTAWQEWKDHLKQKTNNAYSEISERKALSALYKRCDGREKLAIESIDYSIEKNWSAIYLKPFNNEYRNNFSSGGSFNNDKQGGTSTNRMDAVSKW